MSTRDARIGRAAPRSSEAGFTLLELLAVMAVVLVVIGLAVVRFDDNGRRATQSNAERLSMALEAARDAAIYSGKPIAFSSDGVGYQFWSGDSKQHKWLAVSDENQLMPRKLQNDVQIVQQSVNGRTRPLGERLVFSAEGLSEPFALILQGGETQFRVTSDALGRLNVEDPLEDADAR